MLLWIYLNIHNNSFNIKYQSPKYNDIIGFFENYETVLIEAENNKINLIVNTPLGEQSRYDEEAIGKACIQKGIMAITTISAAEAVLHAIRTRNKIKVKSIQEYHS